MPRILVLYYSMYGHIKKLAEAVKEGVESAGGKADIMRVPETLSDEILQKMGALKSEDHPVLTDLDAFANNYDGYILGIPTRFGMMPAQWKAFWDSTGGLWKKEKLVGKPVSVFFSTQSPQSGQETTAMSSMPLFAHHGMIYVPIGYTFPEVQSDFSEVHGGSPWGAGTYAGIDGSPTEKELKLAKHQGTYCTNVFKKFVA